MKKSLQCKENSKKLLPKKTATVPQKGTDNVVKRLSGITYASLKDIKRVIRDKGIYIESALCIFHDKDENEPHFHVLIIFYGKNRPSSVRNWFKWCKDANGKHVNTMFESCRDANSTISYYLHLSDESKEDGKHIYDRSELIVLKGSFDDLMIRHDACDKTYKIFDDLSQGVSLRLLVRKYGKDFVYHYNQYREILNDILTSPQGMADRTKSIVERAMLYDDLTLNHTPEKDDENK